jgi:hypothetical protein
VLYSILEYAYFRLVPGLENIPFHFALVNTDLTVILDNEICRNLS